MKTIAISAIGFKLWSVTSPKVEAKTMLKDMNEFFISWSPDSSKIVYNSESQVWVFDLDSKTRERLTKNGTFLDGKFSPDGKKIVFVSIHNDSSDICIMDYETRVTECFEMDGKNLNPKWSPDGSKIAFVRMDEAGRHLWVMNADGSGKRRISDGVQPEWMSNVELCFLRNHTLYCMDLRGEERKISERIGHYTLHGSLLIHDYGFNLSLLCLNSNKEIELTRSRHDMLPAFSPDGKKIAFITDRSGNFDVWLAEGKLL